MSSTLSSAAAVRTYAHVVSGTVVETLATSLSIESLYPASLTWYDVTSLSPQPVAGWSFSGTVFSAPPVVAPASPKLTSLQFMALLTTAEQNAIATAAQSNAAVLVWLLKISGATYVDLGDPSTIGGVDAMSAAGLLTAARAAEILANQAPAAATATTTAAPASTAAAAPAATVSGGAS